MTAPPAYTPFRLVCQADSGGHGHAEIEHKAWHYSGFTAWELRRVLMVMAASRASFNPSLEVRQHKALWREWCLRMGWSWPAEFFPSARAYKEALASERLGGQRGEVSMIDEQHIRDETSVSTRLLLLLFVAWSQSKRKLKDKALAISMMTGLVGKCAGLGAAWALDVCAIAEDYAHECAATTSGGLCAHLQLVVASAQRLAGQSAAWPGLLGALWASAGECGACAGALSAALTAASEWLHDQALAKGNTNIGKWEVAIAGNKRSRRTDEDLKGHALVSMVKKHQASTSTGAVAAMGVHSNTGQRWIEQQIRDYVSRNFALPGKSVGVVGMCEDGARFGQPARENQVYAVWLAREGVGLWLPPQAPIGVSVCVCWGGGGGLCSDGLAGGAPRPDPGAG